MEIKVSGKECEKILGDYAYVNFGKLLGCEKVDDMSVELDCNYSTIREMIITKKAPEKEQEAIDGESK